jgi:protein-L-isoaspartate(D-aspartate) O-methyltransferase
MGFTPERQQMVNEQLIPRGISDPAVLAAFRKVQREEFINPQHQKLAYIDAPLSIGEGQTISQPFTVAMMTQLLELQPTDKVLEIGTGSGYQAAVIAEIVKGLTRPSGQTLAEGGQVFTIERFKSLARKSLKLLKELKYLNVQVIVGDGTKGLPEEAPFDAIIVTAAAPEIPQPLINQLKIGGRLVMPVDSRPARVDPERSRGVGDDWHQEMVRLTKTADGIKRENFGGYRFVPLVGEFGLKN